MSRVSIKDVAEQANVSLSTVSRVLNNNPTVNPALFERVQQAIVTLGYQPNRTARRLRTQSSDVIGLIISDIQNPYFTSVIRGIEAAAYDVHMNIVLCNLDEDPSKMQTYIDVMREESVAGLIVVPTDDSDAKALGRLRDDGIPVILLDRALREFKADKVKVDNVGGGFNATSHLIKLGHRRIAIIHPDIITGEERFQGYSAAMAAAAIDIDEQLVKIGGVAIESGYALATELITAADPPEALFTATNLVTLGALRALRERDIQVPGDIALVGFDDLPFSEVLFSPLTAVEQPTYELGQTAVRLLLRRLRQPDAAFETAELPTRLIVRKSCGYALKHDKIHHNSA